jgi:hypothetical protein
MAVAWTRNLVVRKSIRLQVIISAIFAMLILPALSVVIAFSYYENAHTLANLLERSVDRARDDAVVESPRRNSAPARATITPMFDHALIGRRTAGYQIEPHRSRSASIAARTRPFRLGFRRKVPVFPICSPAAL